MTHADSGTLHCTDCGKSGNSTFISLHSGAVSELKDEGHVRRMQVALCESCTAKRLELQETSIV